MQHPSTSHVIRALSRGSSWPVVVATEGGEFVLKLRGAAPGLAALVAEIVTAELAECLGLPVPERVLIELAQDFVSDDRRDELADLLERSVGLNLGFRYLSGATDLNLKELDRVDPTFALTTMWLDGLIMNGDRTRANPNVLSWKGASWLIDHGSALPFHHWWAEVDEREPSLLGVNEGHLFAPHLDRLVEVDEHCVSRIGRTEIEQALLAVPDDFLDVTHFGSRERTRAAYGAYLWKRLAAPRSFVPREGSAASSVNG